MEGRRRGLAAGRLTGQLKTGQHVRVTGTAQREAWLARTAPPVEQVRPDLWSVPVPIPDSPLRYTLTYLIAAGSGLVVVDPAGTASQPGRLWRTAWSRGWSSVVGFMRRAALAEAAAHLKHLVDAGRVAQIAAEPVRYRLAKQS